MTLVTTTTAFTRSYRVSSAVRAGFIFGFILASVLIALLASDDFLGNFRDFVLLLLTAFTPWSAINLIDYYLISKERYDIPALYDPDARYGRWNVTALVSYTLGIAVQIPFVAQTLYTGPLAKELGGADISWIVGLIVTGSDLLPVGQQDLDAAGADDPTRGGAGAGAPLRREGRVLRAGPGCSPPPIRGAYGCADALHAPDSGRQPGEPRTDRPDRRRRDARRALRRQQLGRHRRRRRPVHVPAPRAAQHRPRQGRADGRDHGATPTARATSSRSASSVGEGHDQFVDDMFSSHDGRFLYVSRPSFADVVGVRPAHAQDRLARAGRGLPRRPHGDLARRHAAAGLGLDRAQGPRDRHRDAARSSASSSPATSRTRTTTRPTARRSSTPRSARSSRPTDDPALDDTKGDRWFEIVDARTTEGAQAPRHGPEARGGRLSEHELGGAADGARAGREAGLLPGLVLPRLRRVRPRPGQGAAARRPAVSRGGGRQAARGVPARLGPPRARDEPGGRSCASPGRCRTTRRSSTATTSPTSSRPRGHKPYWSTNSRRRPLLLHLVQRRRPRRRSSPTRPSARSRASRSATTRSGCGWASWPTGALGVPARGRPGRPGGPRLKLRVQRARRGACAPGGRCACACA